MKNKIDTVNYRRIRLEFGTLLVEKSVLNLRMIKFILTLDMIFMASCEGIYYRILSRCLISDDLRLVTLNICNSFGHLLGKMHRKELLPHIVEVGL